MCQIIALKTSTKRFKKLKESDYNLGAIQGLLDKKGGDYYGASVIFYSDEKTKKLTVPDFNSINFLFKETISRFIRSNCLKGKMNILLFSRQRPEMEDQYVEEQPYVLQEDDDFTFAVHGTIHNDKELANLYRVDIKADTEILQYMNPGDWYRAQGSFCAIGIEDSDFIEVYEHGMKTWSNYITVKDKILAEIVATAPLTMFNPHTINPSINSSLNNRTLYVAFSGGMDISLSLYKQLYGNNYKKVVLNYFDWGSNASKSEKEAIEKLRDFYSTKFGIQVELKILPTQEYFKSFFEITDTKSKISDVDAKGDHAETESPIAYVPYRNSQFALMLASKAEAQELKHVDILFGLNLSEGMVFMDNSEGWIEAIEETIKYGGKDFAITGDYKVVAPYFPRTKTNMIKEFKDEFGIQELNRILMKSWSCYYPEEDGSPCGECGSCILRQEAIQRALGD